MYTDPSGYSASFTTYDPAVIASILSSIVSHGYTNWVEVDNIIEESVSGGTGFMLDATNLWIDEVTITGTNGATQVTDNSFWSQVKNVVGENIWNSQLIPVAFSYSINIGLNPVGGGNYTPWGYLVVLKGKDEFKGKHFTDVNIGAGWDLGATFVKTEYYFTGDSSILTLENFQGPKTSVNISFSYQGVEVSGTVSFSNVGNSLLIGISTGVGIGAPGPGGGLNGGQTIFY